MRRLLFRLFLVAGPARSVPYLLERGALLGMLGMVLVSFLAANLQALLWQSSQWLVSTILPSVVVELTNDKRVADAASPLQRSSVLDRAAQLKAEHMAKEQYFAHYSPEGVSPWHWFEAVGYTYAYAGENLAIHFNDSGAMVDAWMQSPTHRANVVNGNYTEIGVGTAKGMYQGYETVFVVQLFGTPAQGPAVAMANVETSTKEPKDTTRMPAVVVAATGTDSTASSTAPAPVVASADSALPIVGNHEKEGTTTPSSTPLATFPAITTPRTESVHESSAVLAVDTVTADTGVVSVYSDSIATTSGLPVLLTMPQETSGATKTMFLARIATQPNLFLQTTYMMLGTVVAVMLSLSLLLALRAHELRRVGYSFALFVLMLGLITLHLYLTEGAVIV